MTTQLLERPTISRNAETGGQTISTTTTAEQMTSTVGIESELSTLTHPVAEFVADENQLGQKIMQTAMSRERASFAVKSRSVSHATAFATPIRSMLLTLASGFGGINVTISPSLNLNTWPAMDALVAALDDSGAGELWQPIGERSSAIGAARHLFVRVDNPIRDDATVVFPNVLVEVVGAHLIDPEWFDRIVAPRCLDEALTFVFYGQAGFEGSLFERAWHESQFRGFI
ncbi:MAG: hypothetical protein F4X40_03410 [Chloroflexi bacterium]|nr:hypothetical protein [Chloroflexota bacterium]